MTGSNQRERLHIILHIIRQCLNSSALPEMLSVLVETAPNFSLILISDERMKAMDSMFTYQSRLSRILRNSDNEPLLSEASVSGLL